MGQEDPLEAEMVTQSGVLAWIIPWPEEPGRLQSVGSQRVSHDWAPQHPRTGLKRRVNMESWFTGAETLEQTPPGGGGVVPSQCWGRKTRAVRTPGSSAWATLRVKTRGGPSDRRSPTISPRSERDTSHPMKVTWPPQVMSPPLHSS